VSCLEGFFCLGGHAFLSGEWLRRFAISSCDLSQNASVRLAWCALPVSPFPHATRPARATASALVDRHNLAQMRQAFAATSRGSPRTSACRAGSDIIAWLAGASEPLRSRALWAPTRISPLSPLALVSAFAAVRSPSLPAHSPVPQRPHDSANRIELVCGLHWCVRLPGDVILSSRIM
jgi:hypothetical protein